MENGAIPACCPIIDGQLNKLCGRLLHLERDHVSSVRFSVKVRKKLAEGGSCFVYHVECSGDKTNKKRSKESMALKVTPLPTQQRYCQSLSEANLLRTLPHENIVKFYGESLARQRSHPMTNVHLLLLEYCRGGTLFDAIAAMRIPYCTLKPEPMSTSKYSRMLPQRASSIFSSFSSNKKVGTRNNHLQVNLIHLRRITAILQQVASALAYLHSQSIIHFDIKLENILLVNPLNIPSFCHPDEKDAVIKVKLCDLGSAHKGATIPLNTAAQRQITADLISKSTTPMYKPPECVDSFSCRHIDQKVDVWAFGCITYQLIFYQHVWEDFLGVPSYSTLSRTPSRKINKLLGMKNPQSRHFHGASSTSAATATFSPATPNLAILSGRYHLPPLQPVVPLVLPKVENGILYNSYKALVNMIEQKMLVVQPSVRSPISVIHKEIEQLLFDLSGDSGNKSPQKMVEVKVLTAGLEDDTLETSSSCDDIGNSMRLTVNGDSKSDTSSPCFALQPWAEDATSISSAEKGGSVTDNNGQSSSLFKSYPSEIEVVSVNSGKKSTIIEVG